MPLCPTLGELCSHYKELLAVYGQQNFFLKLARPLLPGTLDQMLSTRFIMHIRSGEEPIKGI